MGWCDSNNTKFELKNVTVEEKQKVLEKDEDGYPKKDADGNEIEKEVTVTVTKEVHVPV